MKSRLLIIIGIIAALGSVATFAIIDMHESNLEKHERIDELTYMSSEKPLQRVLDHCEYQRKFATGEIPERNADGSYNVIDAIGLSFQNSTHYIDNNTCEWIPVYEKNDVFFKDFTVEEIERFFVILPNTVDERKEFVIYRASNTEKDFHFHNQDTIPYKIDGISDNGKNSFTIFIDAQSNWKIDEPDNNYEGVKYIKLSVSNPDTDEIYDWMNYTIHFTKNRNFAGGTIDRTVYPVVDEQLQKVLDSCACIESGGDCLMEEHQWNNNTHKISNIECEWEEVWDGYPHPFGDKIK